MRPARQAGRALASVLAEVLLQAVEPTQAPSGTGNLDSIGIFLSWRCRRHQGVSSEVTWYGSIDPAVAPLGSSGLGGGEAGVQSLLECPAGVSTAPQCATDGRDQLLMTVV